MQWPKGAKCAACFSFDMDSEFSWRNILRRNDIYRDDPVVMSIGLYEVKAGTPRVLGILKKHDIKATFFTAGGVADAHPEMVKEIARNDHEIAHHGYSHIVPTRLSFDDEKREFGMGIDAIRRIAGTKAAGYRSPGEGLSAHTLKFIAENGMLYDSSMMDNDLPYVMEIDGRKIVELPWRWMLDDWVYFGFNYYPPLDYRRAHPESPRKVLEIWMDEFDAIYDEGLYFMLVMHPQQTGQPSRAAILDKLIDHVKSKRNVWIATAREIAENCLKSQ